jgi:hypothetical protein
MSGTVISFPTPPYSNLPIEAQFYKPRRFVISGVSLGTSTTVTTSVDHNYVIGQLVRLIIPPSFGCIQLNEQQGVVLSIPSSTQIVLSLDSSQNVDPYQTSTATTVAQTLAIGDWNSGQINSSGTVNLKINIPGSFENISP